eukprot:TRINITY_DN61829_c0_g1_i1.p1 TRINITY_DN61829_c0_g1~~TRINITY_DN61829_c0_g1_i1.p1  ORF type:complete len:879 (-),score=75.09 TRINITY_DN61829_c0_g1_i1:85-2721(-)
MEPCSLLLGQPTNNRGVRCNQWIGETAIEATQRDRPLVCTMIPKVLLHLRMRWRVESSRKSWALQSRLWPTCFSTKVCLICVIAEVVMTSHVEDGQDREAAILAAAARAAASANEPLDPRRASAFIDCEGLGEEHTFWPQFRRALASEGPLGPNTVHLAYHKWSQWEGIVDELEHNGAFRTASNGYVGGRPNLAYRNGSIVLERVTDKLDIINILSQVGLNNLFDKPIPYAANDLAGFLACPVGFLLVQYCIFIVHKTRSVLSEEDRVTNWDSMMNSFGQILGVPSYSLDHLESGNWGISSFDIAVNLNAEEGGFAQSYAQYFQGREVVPPRFEPWWHDAPGLASAWSQFSGSSSAEKQFWKPAAQLCSRKLGDLGTDGADSPGDGGISTCRCDFRVALLGEHAATNLDHLSSVTEALRRSCSGSRTGNSGTSLVAEGSGMSTKVNVEAAHFFTYVWSLHGTTQGGSVSSTIRMTWEAFWGEPLTASQGRKPHSMLQSPRWTLARALQLLRGWAAREPFLRAADLLVCCEPLWLCVLLHAARGGQRLLVRASMCLLHMFEHFFREAELPAFWPLVRGLASDLSPRGGLSAAARISAEMLDFQTGVRAPYVPALSLHVAATVSYSPQSSDILLFRSTLPNQVSFLRILQLISAELGPTSPNIVDMTKSKTMSFAEIGEHRAVIMLPHVPYALRLSDVYAMGLPLFVPAEPLIHKFVWPFAGPFCGRTEADLVREVDPELRAACSAVTDASVLVTATKAGEDACTQDENNRCPSKCNRFRHPYSPFEFQSTNFEPGAYHEDRRYWIQYTEWFLRPHTLRFRSARELLSMATLSEAQALAINAAVRASHAEMVQTAMIYWQAAAASAAGFSLPLPRNELAS